MSSRPSHEEPLVLIAGGEPLRKGKRHVNSQAMGAQFSDAWAIAYDHRLDACYIADYEANRIAKLDRKLGLLTTFFDVRSPRCLCLMPGEFQTESNDLCVSASNCIYIVSINGDSKELAGSPLSTRLS